MRFPAPLRGGMEIATSLAAEAASPAPSGRPDSAACLDDQV